MRICKLWKEEDLIQDAYLPILGNLVSMQLFLIIGAILLYAL